MEEAEAKLLRDSFTSVMAYLVYPQELRELIEKTSAESANMDAFLDKFKRVVSNETDSTRRTDGQIFLSDLRRRLG